MAMPFSSNRRRLPTSQVVPLMVAFTPLPVRSSNCVRVADPLRSTRSAFAYGGGLGRRCRRGVLRWRTTASANGCLDRDSISNNALATAVIFQAHGLHHLGFAFGDGAGLVQHDGGDVARALQALGVLDQDAVLGALAHAGHDGGGCGQPSAQGQAITSTVTMAKSPCVNACSPPKIHHTMALRWRCR
jgi:hypothetical protein